MQEEEEIDKDAPSLLQAKFRNVTNLPDIYLTSQFWSVVVSVMGSLMMPVMGLVTRWVIGSIMDCHGVGLEVM